MRIHCLIHAPFETPAAIETWAAARGHHITCSHTFNGEKLPPNLDNIDFLILMGGPQSACELDKYPYLKDEIEFTKQAIEENKLVLGICLGAQLIGDALGAPTQRSPNKEIGVYPVTVLKSGLKDPFFSQLYPQFDALHWHSDMPGITDEMVLLAESAGCPHQAFRYGDRVYGFQFHLELTIEIINDLISHCPLDLTPGKYVCTDDELRHENYNVINQRLYAFLDMMEKKWHLEGH
jgi:GMP synthase (glutamine-hydrolysing)